MPSAIERARAEAGTEALRRDVRTGLSRKQKELPSKYFYDERGSALFARITELPEYYLTRAEQELLVRFGAPWLASWGAAALVELGAGDARKTRTLLDALPPGAAYVPIDLSSEYVLESAERLRLAYPDLRVAPLIADITALPTLDVPRPAVFAFLGSTIGNYTEAEAVALLTQLRRLMQPGDALLLGVDLAKDPAVLELAYNDPAGVTAEFNRNVLHVLNRELGADFEPEQFQHVACYDRTHRRIEMHLVSACDQVVRIPGWRAVRFRRGETIRTEISCKYHRPELERMLTGAGLELRQWRGDDRAGYALVVAVPRAQAKALPPPRTRDEAEAWIRQQLVPRPTTHPRVGVEYELLVQHASDHSPAQWDSGEGPLARWLSAHAAQHRWMYTDSGKGAPKYRLPRGGTVTLEPGGQLEYTTTPLADAVSVIADLQHVVQALHDSAARAGLVLLAAGVDPHNPIERVPLQFPSERYRRMAAHFDRIAPEGAVMMRQTASLQLNLDITGPIEESWRLANALPPYLVALYSTSQRPGVWSERTRVWRTLDPLRTGIFPGAADAAAEYATFAFSAPALGTDYAYAQHAADADDASWREHLSTLFPEVRLRGYLELRTIDTLPLERAAEAIRMVCGLFWDDAVRADALEIVGAPDARLLDVAWQEGPEYEALRTRAERLRALGLAADQRREVRRSNTTS